MHFVGFGGVSGSGGVWVEVEDWLVCNDRKVGVIWKFGQVYSCFGPWITLGLVHFVGFGGVLGSGGIWV